ncbi:MAG: hypothetical protein J2P45_01375 [Candidatus Dormibacteraeota bacterium]|nr:hypothetical protein [Candidatus Dormibacteraeota bacterium]
MAAFRLHLYGPPAEEMNSVRQPPVPRWALRLYTTYGVEDPERAPISSTLEAVGEGLHERLVNLSRLLRLVEAEGWVATLDGDAIRVVNDRSREQTHETLERRGVWGLARHLAVKDEGGEVAWL